MKKLLTLSAALVTLAMPAMAADMVSYDKMPAGHYELDKTHAHLMWSVNHAGLSGYIGRFSDFDVDLKFNPEDVTKSEVTVSIDPMSLTTSYPYPEKEDFSKKLATGAQWLNAGEYPHITFKSTKLEKTGDTTGTLTGDLTFLGVTKPVTLDVTFNGAYMEKPHAGVPALGFSATGSLMRSEWGLSTYVPGIGDEVTLTIETELHKAE